MSERHKESAADILRHWKGKGPCDITCRFCGVKVRDDDPNAVWQGFSPGLGGGVSIDEHERCDVIERLMTSSDFETKLDGFFDSIGVAAEDRAAARRVLMFRLGHRWPLGQTSPQAIRREPQARRRGRRATWSQPVGRVKKKSRKR
jgi:hypothetical protein